MSDARNSESLGLQNRSYVLLLGDKELRVFFVDYTVMKIFSRLSIRS